MRRAVRALEARELVMVIKLGGSWSGIGEYGPLVPRWSTYWDDKLDKYMEYGPEVPTAEVRTHWIQEPDPTESFLIRVPVDVEYVHMGMPTGASLWVKLEGEEPEYIAKDRALGG